MKKNRTKDIVMTVDGLVTPVRLTSCNKCPFVSMDDDTLLVYCTKEPDIVKFISNSYSILRQGKFVYPINPIDIPSWCSLPGIDYNIKTNNTIFYRCGQSHVFSERMDETEEIFLHMVVPDSEIMWYHGEICSLDNPVSNYIKQETTDTVCSNCGKRNDNVKRNENMGVCPECYKKLPNKSIPVSYKIMINNFRLKRGIPYIDKIPKTLAK